MHRARKTWQDERREYILKDMTMTTALNPKGLPQDRYNPNIVRTSGLCVGSGNVFSAWGDMRLSAAGTYYSQNHGIM